MNRPPDRRATSPNTEGGFTLIELLVVMVIGSVLLGLTASGWASYQRKSEVRQSVDEVVSVLRNAQQAAFAEATTYCIAFDEANSTYQVFRKSCGAAGTSVGDAKRMRSGSVVLQSPAFKQADGTTTSHLQFTPRGSATKGSVVIRRSPASGKAYTVSVEGLTARVSLA